MTGTDLFVCLASEEEKTKHHRRHEKCISSSESSEHVPGHVKGGNVFFVFTFGPVKNKGWILVLFYWRIFFCALRGVPVVGEIIMFLGFY